MVVGCPIVFLHLDATSVKFLDNLKNYNFSRLKRLFLATLNVAFNRTSVELKSSLVA